MRHSTRATAVEPEALTQKRLVLRGWGYCTRLFERALASPETTSRIPLVDFWESADP